MSEMGVPDEFLSVADEWSPSGALQRMRGRPEYKEALARQVREQENKPRLGQRLQDAQAKR
jgi:hypothetical protein